MKLSVIGALWFLLAVWTPSLAVSAAAAVRRATDDDAAAATPRVCVCFIGICVCSDGQPQAELLTDEGLNSAVKPEVFKDGNYNGEKGVTYGWCTCFIVCYCSDKRAVALPAPDEVLTKTQRTVDGDVAAETRRWCFCAFGACVCYGSQSAAEVSTSAADTAAVQPENFKDASYNGQAGLTYGWCACVGKLCYCRDSHAASLSALEADQEEEPAHDDVDAGTLRKCYCAFGVCVCFDSPSSVSSFSFSEADTEVQTKVFKDGSYKGEKALTYGRCWCYFGVCFGCHSHTAAVPVLSHRRRTIGSH